MSCLGCSDRAWRRRAHLQLGSLDAQLDRARVASCRDPAFLRFLFEPVEPLVGVQWIMVEEDGARCAGSASASGEALPVMPPL